MEVRIIHDNFNKTYKVGEYLSGNVKITTKERAIDINSISVSLTGTFIIKNPNNSINSDKRQVLHSDAFSL